MNVKKIVKEELINEVGGNTILSDFRPEIEKLFIDVLNKYGDKVSETNITYFLMKTVEKVGFDMGFDDGNDPSKYSSNG